MADVTGASKESGSSIAGVYDATVKHGAGCGYTAQWRIDLSGDGQQLTAEELPGSHCCGGVPNLCRKSGCLAHK